MRRTPLLLILVTVLLACFRVQASQPNVLVILTDDMGWADVGFHGGDIPTPNIDRIASTGVILEQFYVQPTCSPTRHALMTGRYPYRYGAHICNLRSHHTHGASLDERFMSEAMQEVGYYTAVLGKWHLGMYRQAYWPTSRGFEMHYGLLSGGLDYFTHINDKVTLDWQELHADRSVWKQPLREKGYTTDLLGQRAVKLIGEHDFDQRPLFLYLSFNAPHTPMQAKPEDVKRFNHVKDSRRRTYSAMMHATDVQVGRVLDALEKRGVDDNTLVIFFSDNGGAGSNASSNEPLRGGKGSQYEGGVRVPAAVTWPGTLKPGQRFSTPLHVVDLFPTFVGLAGGDTTLGQPLDGLDFWPALSTGETLPERVIYHNVADTSGRGSVRSGDWKFMAIKKAKAPKDSVPLPGGKLHGLLFNIAEDPNETKNLAKQRPELVDELWGKLKARGPEVVSAKEYCTSAPKGWKAPRDHSSAAE
ncbi:arylsulfatase A-like enzyme [Algisphaera agarilytica]|uniref:Arylsulfatase A-like enzyme n=1 Tax=Algisphaera agarilytica TaxID=1385975 RepID=A0A7X0H4M8_9BACT|nr:arylsulfatase A-like enzyme [Algisphaera agarilytica]